MRPTSKMEETKFGYYGLREKPTFEKALDAAKKPLRIPLPDRPAKRAIMSLYRAKLLENAQIAAGFDLARTEHSLSDETAPAAVIFVQPSPSADDALFEEMAKNSHRLWENEAQRQLRHRVDEEARQRMRGERHGDLSEIYSQGGTSAILQAQVPLDVRFKEETEDHEAQGYKVQRLTVDRAAPVNLPRAQGYGPTREFPTYAELNGGLVRPVGQVAGERLAVTGESYETLRRATGVVRDY